MSKNIQMQTKTESGYKSLYPASDAVHTERNKKIISYLQGDNVLEIIQETANQYLVPDNSQWFETVQGAVLNSSSMMCVQDNFICVVTPNLIDDSHYQVNCAISHNGGVTWGNTSFIPQTNNYIVEMIGVKCIRKNNIQYEVTMVGRRYLSDTEVYTYQLYIPHNTFTITNSKELDILNI